MNMIVPGYRLARTSSYYRSARLLVQLTMLGLLLVLSVRAAHYLGYAARAVEFPFGLDYAEGIVWQQALLIPGPRMYGEITQPPFIVFHYPPVYHLLVRAIGALGIDPLAAGRGVSLAATMVIAVLAGSITLTAMQESASTGARIFGSVLAGLMVLSYQPVEFSAVLMREDMLAIAFSMAGVHFSIVAGQSTKSLCIAVLMFALAVYTKQTELAAPIAALLIASIINLRSALKASAFGFVISGAGLIIMLLATDGGFWRHVVEYNLHNRFFVKDIMGQLMRRKPDGLGLLTGVAAFAFLWWTETTSYQARDLRGWAATVRQSKKLRALSILSLWFVLASAQLITVGKAGSWDNYFVEWMCITTVPIGMAATAVWAGVARPGKSAAFSGLAGLLLSLALAKHALHRSPFEFSVVHDPRGTALRAHLVDLIRKSPKPVLSDDMVLLLRAGQEVFIEPSIFTELSYTGYWDQGPLLNLIQGHAFGLVITAEPMKGAVGGGVLTKEVASAIENSYPVVEHLDNYVVWGPTRP